MGDPEKVAKVPEDTAETTDPASEAELAAKRAAIVRAVRAAKEAQAAADRAEKERVAKETLALADMVATDKAESKDRKVRPEDLFGEDQAVTQKIDAKPSLDDKVKSYRMQGEFGAKKFIKP